MARRPVRGPRPDAGPPVGLGALGLKAVTFFPRNEGTELDSHQGAVLLFEAGRGRLLAIIDATSLTSVRTAAVSGLATRLLARDDAGDLALVGSGVEARTHLEAMLAVRKLRRIRVASKTLERAKSFAERESKRHGITVTPSATVEDRHGRRHRLHGHFVARAVLLGEWLRRARTSTPSARAWPPPASSTRSPCCARGSSSTGRRAALAEAGDFLIPKGEGAVDDRHIREELGQVVVGAVAGRLAPTDVTVFKSVGLAIEDVAAAQHIYSKARGSGFGKFVEFGGGRHEAD